MKPLRSSLAAFVALTCLFLCGAAEANGRAGPSIQSAAAPVWHRGAAVVGARYAWRSSSDLVNEAARYIGSGKFTGLPGAWCADAVSAWLRATGRRPLASRMAASALVYGPHVSNPSPGDLVVMATRRGYAGHVGIFEGVEADGSVRIISGNWGHRVAEGHIARWQVTAFVRP
jgi:uncharacterized protein (TIGR02594 family)